MDQLTSRLNEREVFAALAMQALITKGGSTAEFTSQQAVAFADALIEALRARAPMPRRTDL
jgi:hypothetical protein